MHTFAIVSFFVVAAVAAPQQKQQVAIIKLNSDVSPEGSFTYEWESADGQRGEARGTQTGPESQSVQGSFAFQGDDGQTYQVQYLADENGFQPQGAHLPTPPPIPAEILKSLEFNAKNPEPEDRQQAPQVPFRAAPAPPPAPRPQFQPLRQPSRNSIFG